MTTPLTTMVDADEHYYEPDDAFTRYLPMSFIDEGRALHIVRTPDRAEGRVFIGDKKVTFFGANPCDSTGHPGALLEYFRSGGGTGNALFFKGKMNADDLPESRQRETRLAWLERENIEATLLFPTIAVGVEYELARDVPALTAGLTAFNRWLEDDWGYGGDGPLYGVPLLNLTDIEWAVDELETVIGKGAKVVHLRPGPVAGKWSPADPRYDPFWMRCAEAGVAVAFHLGNSGEADYYSAMWSESPKPPNHRFSPFQRVTSFGERAIGDTLVALVTHNLFGRVPDLTVMSVEFGCEWVAPMLKKMDRAARMCGPKDWPFGVVTERPREIFKRHVKVAPYPEDNTVALIDLLGADAVLAGSDWPHPEGETHPFDFATRIQDEVSEADFRKVVHDNLAGILGIEVGSGVPA
jgi:predicted TIM-barrel fold metal-dependent hydrolase